MIEESWTRVRRRGLRHTSPLPDPTDPHEEAEHRHLRDAYGAALAHTQPLIDDGMTMVVLSDQRGRLLDAIGRGSVRSHADEIGFSEGRLWSETSIGTNAIGTALIARRAVAVHGAEHYRRDQHAWSCAAAPVRDPRSGAIAGAIDLSTTTDAAHPTMLALASSLAHAASLELERRHHASLERLRSAALSMAREQPEPWIAVDTWGWVADAHRADVGARVPLSSALSEGIHWIPPWGEVAAEPLGGGWLLRPALGRAAVAAETKVEIHHGSQGVRLWVTAGAHRRSLAVTPRQAQILDLLNSHPAGFSAPELSAVLYGTPEKDVTVRAEFSRLRRQLGGLIAAHPYRFADGVRVSVFAAE
ncbi:GAF domain-containing protein [Microbacterium sp. gxy059]|uniref:GAF domain-containing protein n=1 Tax=Microbacterium sp. gxy059 TaxID=2957199 RepID=UPI003D967EAD